MTNEEAKKMLKAKLECLKHETSGTDYACNQHICEGCSLNYEQGNMGEQKVALDMAIKALEQTRWIPVSEREAKYPCLACDKYGQIFIPIGVVTIDGHSYDGLHFEFDAEKFLKGHPREIIAWMSLPQPYKVESEGGDGE